MYGNPSLPLTAILPPVTGTGAMIALQMAPAISWDIYLAVSVAMLGILGTLLLRTLRLRGRFGR